ncbi:hypothetical protein LCGC14_0612960 [marine sediment metagenome]|uniref:HTH cro/C1-type domain-containing protein n=1 Tax=marine sediment metagenome TaxID=412755 RepID=A0A0F9RBV5_9ZZZZ
MNDEREKFAIRLEFILNQQQVTRRQIAEDTGCTGATIGRWLRGEVPYCINILAELHRQYGVDLNELICGRRLQIKKE